MTEPIINVQVRLTETDLTRLMSEATKTGMSLQQWMRYKLLDGVQDSIITQDAAPLRRIASKAKHRPMPQPEPPSPQPEDTYDDARWAKLPELRDNFSSTALANVFFGNAQRAAVHGPRGLDNILTFVGKLKAHRDLVIKRHRSKHGKYRIEMARFWEEQGLDGLSSNERFQYTTIAKHYDPIKLWVRSLLDFEDRDTVSPWSLLNRFQNRDRNRQGPPQTRQEVAASLASKGIGPVIRFEGGVKIGMGTLERSIPVQPAIDPQAQVTNLAPVVYQRFSAVELVTLDPGHARVLRRFTSRLLMNQAYVTTEVPQRKLATVIEKIKNPDESGEEPPTARVLKQLGVLAGNAGAYQLRKEYVERVEEVAKWASKATT